MSNGKKNDFIIKEIDGREYEIRFTTFHPKTREEAALALKVDSKDSTNDDIISNARLHGITAEALVPVVKSITDIRDLENLYSEKFIVDRLVQGLAINAQAKAKATLQSLARPSTNGKMSEATRDSFINKITPEWYMEMANLPQHQHAEAFTAEIKRLSELKD